MEKKHLLLVLAWLMLHSSAWAHGTTGRRSDRSRTGNFPCASSTSQIDQSINNVRARLLGGGDMWWDPNEGSGKYIVPNTDPTLGQPAVSAMFAAGIWIAGLDPAGNLKLAAQTYRSATRNDYWPGPLDPVTGTTDQQTCTNWDRHFRVTSAEIRQHLSNLAQGNLNPDDIPKGLKQWPARGNPFFAGEMGFALPSATSRGLAGFFDADADQQYNPLKGDYPSLEIGACTANGRYPDEMIFWIFNDEGSGATHTASGGEPLQMEVQVTAFGYQTADALNDMTFQHYRIINRGQESLDSTFFALWVDPNLGCYSDDKFGFDSMANMMFIYNKDATDGEKHNSCDCGEVDTYCEQVPMIGIDMLKGPTKTFTYLDTKTGQFVDSTVELEVTSFIYNMSLMPSGFPQHYPPNFPAEYYSNMTGRWRDGLPITYGGSGYDPNSTNVCRYVFPSSPNDENGWSMCTEFIHDIDPKAIQSSGPFHMAPGAANELVFGVPFVRDARGGCPDLERLLRVDKLAQQVFDQCFQNIKGPDAPTVDWVSLDRQLIAVLSNNDSTNNPNETFVLPDPYAPNRLLYHPDPLVRDSANYKFEGYKIYQLRAPDVSVSDFDDPDLARLVAQTDRKNGVSRIFNWEAVPDPLSPDDSLKKVYIPIEKVMGADEGIRHTFLLTEDAFATGNARQLINHKKYYYAAVAYAHNNYAPFTYDGAVEQGQQRPYLEGGAVQTYTVIPRPVVDKVLRAAYGDSFAVTRIAGEGTGGNWLEIDAPTREAMLNPDFNGEIAYALGKGPLNITVFNPFEVQSGNYEVAFFDSDPTDAVLDKDAHWRLYHQPETGSEYALVATSDKGLNELNEQVFAQHGFSISMGQTGEPGDYITAREEPAVPSPGPSNGALGATITYTDEGLPWLLGFPDQNEGVFNFIRTGAWEKDQRLDPMQTLGNMGAGFFVPFALASGQLDYGPPTASGWARTITPAWTAVDSFPLKDPLTGLSENGSLPNPVVLRQLPNVDLVLTPDKSKWSRCIVVETANEYYTGLPNNLPSVQIDPKLVTESGPGRKRQSFDLRYGLSVGKEDQNGDGLPDPDLSVEPDSLSDPKPDNPFAQRANPLKGQPTRGMGWFPGYAVNVETGERLNLFFGENSAYSQQLDASYTGRDMTWNPTNQYVRADTTIGEVTDLLLGGHHWVYVTNTPYDECAYLRSRLNPDYWGTGLFKTFAKRAVMPQIAWAGMLALAPEQQLLPFESGLIPTETLVQLRVQNAYGVTARQQNGHPRYRFRIDGGQTRTELVKPQIATALDSIKVVPNPYFGYSAYEAAWDNQVVKITNLPPRCVVTIYTLSGQFVRQFKRDEQYSAYQQVAPALEWDMKNAKGYTVASGVYLIQVNAYEWGERTLKWMGIARDLEPR